MLLVTPPFLAVISILCLLPALAFSGSIFNSVTMCLLAFDRFRGQMQIDVLHLRTLKKPVETRPTKGVPAIVAVWTNGYDTIIHLGKWNSIQQRLTELPSFFLNRRIREMTLLGYSWLWKSCFSLEPLKQATRDIVGQSLVSGMSPHIVNGDSQLWCVYFQRTQIALNWADSA